MEKLENWYLLILLMMPYHASTTWKCGPDFTKELINNFDTCSTILDSIGPQVIEIKQLETIFMKLTHDDKPCMQDKGKVHIEHQAARKGKPTYKYISLNPPGFEYDICNKTLYVRDVAQLPTCNVTVQINAGFQLKLKNNDEKHYLSYELRTSDGPVKGVMRPAAIITHEIRETGIIKVFGKCGDSWVDIVVKPSKQDHCLSKYAMLPGVICEHVIQVELLMKLLLLVLCYKVLIVSRIHIIFVPIYYFLNRGIHGIVSRCNFSRCQYCLCFKGRNHKCVLSCINQSSRMFTPTSYREHMQDTNYGNLVVSGCRSCKDASNSTLRFNKYKSSRKTVMVILIIVMWFVPGILTEKVGTAHGRAVYYNEACEKLSYHEECRKRAIDGLLDSEVKLLPNVSQALKEMTVKCPTSNLKDGLKSVYTGKCTASEILSEDMSKFMHKYMDSLQTVQSGILTAVQLQEFNEEVRIETVIEMNLKPYEAHEWKLTHEKTTVKVKAMVSQSALSCSYDYQYTTCSTSTITQHTKDICTGDCSQCTIRPGYTLGTFQQSSNWLCEEVGCLAVKEGCLCVECRNEPQPSDCYDVYKKIDCEPKIEICLISGPDAWCKGVRSGVSEGYILNAVVIPEAYQPFRLIAVKENLVHVGPINELGEHDQKFGSLQRFKNLTIQYNDDDFHATYKCSSIGPKIVTTKRCMHDTSHLVSLLEPKSRSSFMFNEGKLLMEGELKGYVKIGVMLKDLSPTDLRGELPGLTVSQFACSECSICGPGYLTCNVKLISTHIFTARLNCPDNPSGQDSLRVNVGMSDSGFILNHNKELINCSLYWSDKLLVSMIVRLKVKEIDRNMLSSQFSAISVAQPYGSSFDSLEALYPFPHVVSIIIIMVVVLSAMVMFSILMRPRIGKKHSA